jgi:hypothetical protein
MDREALQQRLQQRPFQPFRLVLTDGRVFDIHYPKMNQLARTFIKVGIPVPDAPEPTCDHLVYIPLTQIARTEPLPVSAGPQAS